MNTPHPIPAGTGWQLKQRLSAQVLAHACTALCRVAVIYTLVLQSSVSVRPVPGYGVSRVR